MTIDPGHDLFVLIRAHHRVDCFEYIYVFRSKGDGSIDNQRRLLENIWVQEHCLKVYGFRSKGDSSIDNRKRLLENIWVQEKNPITVQEHDFVCE